MTCACCDHWYPHDPVHDQRVSPVSTGDCRKRAPVVGPPLESMRWTTAFWPSTIATHGCGDHQRHPTRRLAE